MEKIKQIWQDHKGKVIGVAVVVIVVVVYWLKNRKK